jgi:signal peptidase II
MEIEGMAMKAISVKRRLVFLSIAFGGCALDLATKRWMFDSLGMPHIPPNKIWWIWDRVFGFQTSLNEGGLFGFGQGWAPLFAGLSIAAVVGIFIWLFFLGAAKNWILVVALGCVTAGIFGNLYDRLGFPGLIWDGLDIRHAAGESVHAVRDFVLIMFGRWTWPNFNLADSFLVCGAILLGWHAFSVPPKHTEKPVE